MFEVDRKGLRQILAYEPPERLIQELVSNAWDEEVSLVMVEIKPHEQKGRVEVTVTDNSPNGWVSLKDAYTLFAPSTKKGDACKRGRFNLGEKLVAAVAEEMEIVTTTGTVLFSGDERSQSRKRRETGTQVRCVFRWPQQTMHDVADALYQLIPPDGVDYTVNGKPPWDRRLIGTTRATLPTVLSDENGDLRRTARVTTVEVWETSNEEPGRIYEMGIPVVETGDPFHANVKQKVPLTVDRTNVPPSFLRKVRGYALNVLSESGELTEKAAQESWATNAVESGLATQGAVKDFVAKRFGEKSVAYDPSDTEASKRAMSEGYTVVSGGSLSRDAWDAVKKSEAMAPAGRLFPTMKIQSSPDGTPPEPEDSYTKWMLLFVVYAKNMARVLIDVEDLEVRFYRHPIHVSIAASYSPGRLSVNLNRFKSKIEAEDLVAWDELLVHEFTHHTVADHLDRRFADTGIALALKLGRVRLDRLHREIRA